MLFCLVVLQAPQTLNIVCSLGLFLGTTHPGPYGPMENGGHFMIDNHTGVMRLLPVIGDVGIPIHICIHPYPYRYMWIRFPEIDNGTEGRRQKSLKKVNSKSFKKMYNTVTDVRLMKK